MSRSYTPEFKKDALRYVKEHKGSSDLHTIADNLGVPYHTLYGWIKDERRIQRLSSAEKAEGQKLCIRKSMRHPRKKSDTASLSAEC